MVDLFVVAERVETLNETKTLAKREYSFKLFAFLLFISSSCDFMTASDVYLLSVAASCVLIICSIVSPPHYELEGYRLKVFCLDFEELSHLLKTKDIDASNPGRILDTIEANKERLLARDEERAKKQSEPHILTKALSNHQAPRQFASRRSDENPKGFNLPKGCLFHEGPGVSAGISSAKDTYQKTNVTACYIKPGCYIQLQKCRLNCWPKLRRPL